MYYAYFAYSVYLPIFMIYPVFLQLCSGTAAHNDCSAIFKSAAWYALIDRLDEEVPVDGILSCSNSAVLTAYIDGLIKTSVRLWKLIMPKEAREVFQKEVFHST